MVVDRSTISYEAAKGSKGERMAERLSSGQMAKQNRLSEKALRIYQEKEILLPDYVDESNGYRYYDIQQSTKLDMILQLQQVGFSLDEIAQINKQGSMEYLRDALFIQLEEIQEKERKLAQSRKLAERIVESCERYFHHPPLEQIILEMLPERRILKFENPHPERCQADSGYNNAQEWEKALRKARQEIVDRGWPLVLFGNMGTLIPQTSIQQGLPLKTHSFAYADETFGSCYDEADVLPGGEHLTLYLYQAYKDGKELDSQRLLDMAAYAQEKGMRICGDAFGEALCRYPRFFDMGDNLLYRLCIPVAC